MNILKILLLLFYTTYSNASSNAEIVIENRTFESDSNDLTEDMNTSIVARLEVKKVYRDTNLKARAFVRTDYHDSNRNSFVIEDAYLSKSFLDDSVGVNIGFQIFNWSALEVFHPADTLNARILDGNINYLEKYGQLNVGSFYQWDSGQVQFFYFPFWKSPQLPSNRSRLGPSVTLEQSAWFDENGKIQLRNSPQQYGLELDQTVHSIDLSLHYLRRVDNELPLIGLDLASGNIRGIFALSDQFGLTLQTSLWEILLKFEGVIKRPVSGESLVTAFGIDKFQDYEIIAGGLEYTWYFQSGLELTSFLEFQKLMGLTKNDPQNTLVFDQDLFLGLRLFLNDTQGTEFFLSVINDVEDRKDIVLDFKFSRRLNNFWKYNVGVKYFEMPKNPIVNFGNYIYADLTRYF